MAERSLNFAGPRRRKSLEWVGEIEAVAFDAYGTLINFHDDHFASTMASICAAQGLAADGADFWRRFVRHAIAFYTKSRANGHSYHRYGDMWPAHFGAAFRSLRLDGDPHVASMHLREALASADAHPEAHEVVDALRPRYRLALLSNADDDFLLPCLERNRLHFPVLVSSERARAMKPNPAIFQLLAGELGIKPSSILHVGDSPFADVVGAREAGLRVAWINRAAMRKPRRVPEPDLRLRSLRELLPILDACG